MKDTTETRRILIKLETIENTTHEVKSSFRGTAETTTDTFVYSSLLAPLFTLRGLKTY